MENIITILISTITLFATVLSATAQNKLPFQLEQDWELSDFANPESVVLDAKNSVLYISNINRAATEKDGNGYISKVSLIGFLTRDWLAGKLFYYAHETKTITEALDLPKGSTDTYFDKNTKSVFIPLMLDGKLLKYHFKK